MTVKRKTRIKNNQLLVLDNSNAVNEFKTIEQDDFILPTKVYGDLDSTVDRVLETFNSRKGNLGVLFSGIKGNSKTTIAKMICQKSGLPVVIITESFVGSDFKNFLSSIKEETIIFLDEFEKVYNTPELQQEYLSILDGVFEGKKLFLFTSNSEKINEFLRNRPSRIFYHFKHDNLDESVVNDIIEQELEDKSFEEDLRALLLIIGSISIDVLLNIIDEVNRFKKSPKELVKGLNVEVEQLNFSVIIFTEGGRYETKCNFNPLTREEFYLDYRDDKERYRWLTGNFSDYTMYTRGGSFVFENQQNKLIFTPFKPFKFEL